MIPLLLLFVFFFLFTLASSSSSPFLLPPPPPLPTYKRTLYVTPTGSHSLLNNCTNHTFPCSLPRALSLLSHALPDPAPSPLPPPVSSLSNWKNVTYLENVTIIVTGGMYNVRKWSEEVPQLPIVVRLGFVPVKMSETSESESDEDQYYVYRSGVTVIQKGKVVSSVSETEGGSDVWEPAVLEYLSDAEDGGTGSQSVAKDLIWVQFCGNVESNGDGNDDDDIQWMLPSLWFEWAIDVIDVPMYIIRAVIVGKTQGQGSSSSLLVPKKDWNVRFLNMTYLQPEAFPGIEHSPQLFVTGNDLASASALAPAPTAIGNLEMIRCEMVVSWGRGVGLLDSDLTVEHSNFIIVAAKQKENTFSTSPGTGTLGAKRDAPLLQLAFLSSSSGVVILRESTFYLKTHVRGSEALFRTFVGVRIATLSKQSRVVFSVESCAFTLGNGSPSLVYRGLFVEDLSVGTGDVIISVSSTKFSGVAVEVLREDIGAFIPESVSVSPVSVPSGLNLSLTVTDSDFRGGWASMLVDHPEARIMLSNTKFVDGTGTSLSHFGTFVADHCVFEGNGANDGGALYVVLDEEVGSSLELFDCLIEGNAATGASGCGGGAVFVWKPKREHHPISHPSYVSFDPATVFRGNNASFGGAVFFNFSTAIQGEQITIHNSAFVVENRAEQGGGIYIDVLTCSTLNLTQIAPPDRVRHNTAVSGTDVMTSPASFTLSRKLICVEKVYRVGDSQFFTCDLSDLNFFDLYGQVIRTSTPDEFLLRGVGHFPTGPDSNVTVMLEGEVHLQAVPHVVGGTPWGTSTIGFVFSPEMWIPLHIWLTNVTFALEVLSHEVMTANATMVFHWRPPRPTNWLEYAVIMILGIGGACCLFLMLIGFIVCVFVFYQPGSGSDEKEQVGSINERVSEGMSLMGSIRIKKTQFRGHDRRGNDAYLAPHPLAREVGLDDVYAGCALQLFFAIPPFRAYLAEHSGLRCRLLRSLWKTFHSPGAVTGFLKHYRAQQHRLYTSDRRLGHELLDCIHYIVSVLEEDVAPIHFFEWQLQRNLLQCSVCHGETSFNPSDQFHPWHIHLNSSNCRSIQEGIDLMLRSRNLQQGCDFGECREFGSCRSRSRVFEIPACPTFLIERETDDVPIVVKIDREIRVPLFEKSRQMEFLGKVAARLRAAVFVQRAASSRRRLKYALLVKRRQRAEWWLCENAGAAIQRSTRHVVGMLDGTGRWECIFAVYGRQQTSFD